MGANLGLVLHEAGSPIILVLERARDGIAQGGHDVVELRANRIDCPNDSAPGSASVSRVMTRRPSGSSTTPNPNGTSPR